MQPVYDLLKYLLIQLLIFAVYIHLSSHFIIIGGASSQLFLFEVPLLLIISSLLYFPSIKSRLIKYLLPALPTLVIYICIDVFYHHLHRTPLPSDFENLFLLSEFATPLLIGFFSLIAFIPTSLALLVRQASKQTEKKSFIRQLSYKGVLLSIVLFALLSGALSTLLINTYQFVNWSPGRDIAKNGRLTSTAFYALEQEKNKKLIKFVRPQLDKDLLKKHLYFDPLEYKRNIHLIVLESFIDPRQISDASFSRDPLAEALHPYLHNNNFSHVISPAYGGDTAQAEFELLTGVPALSKLNSIEFNVMQGIETTSLVSLLKQQGYQAQATIATSSKFFNAARAYKSLGFEAVDFLRENPEFNNLSGDSQIFDGTLFDYNIKTLEARLKQTQTPLFNYVLGMYGHTPYERNLTRRPNVFQTHHTDEQVHKIAHQFFYRTQALANYIQQLKRLDPESIIYITSDHLPPIIKKNIRYKLDKYVNISILINHDSVIDVSNKRYYEIPWSIWDLLSQKNTHPRILSPAQLELTYYSVIIGAMDEE